MIIAIASGKGGTGKTTIAVNLALSVNNVQLLDVDVEEPNVNLFLHTTFDEEKSVSVSIPDINEHLCTYCGKCSEFCAYNALAVVPNHVLLFPELCHSCKGCGIICPVNAVGWKHRSVGIVRKGEINSLSFVEGELNLGESMAIPVIKAVKKEMNSKKNIIIDSPPGTSCPVIEAIQDVDFVILVTEPTPFGLHDLKLTVDVVRRMHIPFGVIINQEGIGDKRVEIYCQHEGIPILMKIPHDKKIASLYSNGEPFVLRMPLLKRQFQEVFAQIEEEYLK